MDKKISKYLKTPVNIDNLDELSFLLCGIIADLIFGKNYFTKNTEIRTFTTKILEEDYKDYLFASRTLLYARIIKDLRNTALNEPDIFLNKATNIKHYIEEKTIKNNNLEENQQKKKDKQRSKKNDPIDEWRRIINPK